MIRTLIFFALLLTVYGCSSPNGTKEYLVDNPTDERIAILIDKQSYEIPANAFVKVSIPYGQHELTYDGKKVRFVMVPCDQEVIINPTLSNYVLFYQLYFNPLNGLDDEAKATIEPEYKFDQILPNGDTVKVPYIAVNDLFIERYKYYWHQGVDQPIKENIVLRTKEDYRAVPQAKLFREREFRAYIDFPSDIVFTKTATSYESIEKTDPFSSFSFACPSATAILNQRKAKYDSLINQKDGREIGRLRDEICGIYSDPKKRISEEEALTKCKTGDAAEASAFDIKKIAFSKHLDATLLSRNVYVLATE